MKKLNARSLKTPWVSLMVLLAGAGGWYFTRLGEVPRISPTQATPPALQSSPTLSNSVGHLSPIPSLPDQVSRKLAGPDIPTSQDSDQPSLFSSAADSVPNHSRGGGAANRSPGPPEGLNRADWNSIQEAHQHWLHSFVQTEDGFRAKNPGERFVAVFDPAGFRILPKGGGWEWGLELVSYGFAGQEVEAPPVGAATAEGQRLVRPRGENLTEWFYNDPRGLEQGWILRARPPGDPSTEPLRLVLSARGNLRAKVERETTELVFLDESGAPCIRYTGLKAWDAGGEPVKAWFETTAQRVEVAVLETHARYPITIDPLVQQIITSPGSTPSSASWKFGLKVASAGDTVVVGAPYEDSGATGVNGNQADSSAPDSGAVFVYVRRGDQWSQQAYLKASNTGQGDRFGAAVAISGDTVVVGAAREDSSAKGINGNGADNSAADSGAAYVFARNGTTWTQQAYLKASNTGGIVTTIFNDEGDLFGTSVSVSADTIVVGAPGEDGGSAGVNGDQADKQGYSSAGAAYVFVRRDSTWTQQAYLKASNADGLDKFGSAVSISGDTLVVGAISQGVVRPGTINGQSVLIKESSGAAYVFVRAGATWSQQAFLKASHPGIGDQFGFSVAVSGDTVVVGAPFEDSNATGINGNENDNSITDAGAAYIFARLGATWNQHAFLKAPTTGKTYLYFGWSVSVSGDRVAVGGIRAVAGMGAVFMFERSGSVWAQKAILTENISNVRGGFGYSVALSGNMVVVGTEVQETVAVFLPDPLASERQIYQTHPPSAQLDNPSVLGAVPVTRIPPGVGFRLLGPSNRLRIGPPDADGYRPIFAEGIVGVYEAHVYADSNNNNTWDTGEAIRAVIQVRFRPFMPEDEALEVPSGLPIQPPKLPEASPLSAREIVRLSPAGVVEDVLNTPVPSLAVTRDANGNFSSILPNEPMSEIRMIWRQAGSEGIAWPVRHVRYQVAFNPGGNPLRFAHSSPSQAGPGLQLQLPTGLAAEVVYAAHLTDSTPAGYSLNDGVFSATVPGRFLLKLDPTPGVAGGEVYLPVIAHPSGASELYDGQIRTAIIGEEISRPANTISGHVHVGSGYAAALPKGGNIYADTGQIIPVNKESGVEIWWRQRREITVPGIAEQVVFEYPGAVRRYNFVWPVIPASGPLPKGHDPAKVGKIVIASQQGSGPIDPTAFKQWDLYYQNNPGQPGFNPNEEHAAVFPVRGTQGSSAVFALRDDLGQFGASEPYVLVYYRAATDTDANRKYLFKVFRVVAEDPAQRLTFNYSGEAGKLIEPIYPLNLLKPSHPQIKSQGVAGPFFKDWKGDLWARAAGDDGGSTQVKVDWYYRHQESFYYPVGAISYQLDQEVPFLDSNTRNPRDVAYTVTWPKEVLSLRMGETWVRAKNGLPAIEDLDSVQVIYEQGRRADGTGSKDNVKLIDFARMIKVKLSAFNGLAGIPSDVASQPEGAFRKFNSLPPALAQRLDYDPMENELRFKGLLTNSVLGDPWILPNVITPLEREVLLHPAFRGGDVRFQNALSALCDAAAQAHEIPGPDDIKDPATALVFDSMAVTAGSSEAEGYVTLAMNNDPDFSSSDTPVDLFIFRVVPELYRGALQVITPASLFDEKLTLVFDGDLAGLPGRYAFEWSTTPSSQIPNPSDPASLPGGSAKIRWDNYTSGNGRNSITIAGPGLQTLSDNYFTMRFRPLDPAHPLFRNGQGWSQWTPPQLAEGWIKRVLGRLNPFEQRFRDLSNPTRGIDTRVTMVSLAGPRWEGDIPLTDQGSANSGLLEVYETIFQRGADLSIDGTPAVDYPDANNALLLAANRIADMYLLLGNEAYADASDPTLSVGTQYATSVGTIHAFMNIVGGSSLLEEELSLLRGRDDSMAPGVNNKPVYNRLLWNFTGGRGEVAYANNYGIRDHNNSGSIDEADAKTDYPQGHGDAWGHYLTAAKNYYRLLRHPQFTWQRRSEQVLLGGVPVEVDYLDERTFAKAAAARARTGTEILALTYRDRYQEDPNLQWRGYKDAHAYPDGSKRAWGVDEWACRAGQGAFLDWAVGNALLPAEDKLHTGIQKIDRTTVSELRDLAASLVQVQTELDKADSGLNPLGLLKNALPLYELTSADVDAGATLFEKAYQRAVTVLNNALAVFNRADQASQQLRAQSDSLAEFQKSVDEQERDYRNRLIEIFGYPYANDMGGGGAYPAGYEGPDIYHYMYVDPSELTGVDQRHLAVETVTLRMMDYGLEQPRASAGNRIDGQGVAQPVEKPVTFHLSTQGYGFIKPPSWTGTRRAQGQLQAAHAEILQARSRLERAITEYDHHLALIEDRLALLEAQKGLNASEINLLHAASQTQQQLNAAMAASRRRQANFRTLGRIASNLSSAQAESLPKLIIAGLASGGDFTSAGRSSIRMMGTLIDRAMSMAADEEHFIELGHQQAKERVQDQKSLTLDTLRQEFGIKQEIKQIESLIRQEAGLRLEVYSSRELMLQATERYKAILAQGLRLADELRVFRQKTAVQVQSLRYKDMAFRIFRNDALEKYRAQFDVAATWVYMAARAYDFDSNWAGDGNEPQGVRPGHEFLEAIIKTRAIGEISNNQPITSQNGGDGGLAGPMALMKLNWDNYKGQLGYNQPQNEKIQFSLRRELFRIPEGSRYDKDWRERLQQLVVEDVLQIPEFRRYCIPPQGATREPALAIPFSTTIENRMNLFGWPAAGGDSSYSASAASVKIHKTGVWFANYNSSSLGLLSTPRVYLVPLGADIMRSPRVTSTREWRILEQVIPIPFPLSPAYARSLPGLWTPMMDPNSFQGNEADIRRHSDFRAYHDGGAFDSSQLITNSRLIGRSVWNTRWLLVIRGGALLNDPDEALQRFINGALVGGQRDGQGVKDIRLSFQTYSISGF